MKPFSSDRPNYGDHASSRPTCARAVLACWVTLGTCILASAGAQLELPVGVLLPEGAPRITSSPVAQSRRSRSSRATQPRDPALRACSHLPPPLLDILGFTPIPFLAPRTFLLHRPFRKPRVVSSGDVGFYKRQGETDCFHPSQKPQRSGGGGGISKRITNPGYLLEMRRRRKFREVQKQCTISIMYLGHIKKGDLSMSNLNHNENA